jgi:hypothetical protein
MNPDTGAIGHFEKKRDAIAAGFTLELSAEQATELSPPSRKERRRRAREMKVDAAAARNPRQYKQRKKKRTK